MGKSKKSEHIFRTSFGDALGLSKKDRRQSAALQGSRRCFKPLISFRIGLAMLSAGSPLGLNVEAALRSLWTLFRGWPSGRVRFTRRLPSVHACCLSFDKQDGLRDVAFLFRRVEIAIRAFS